MPFHQVDFIRGRRTDGPDLDWNITTEPFSKIGVELVKSQMPLVDRVSQDVVANEGRVVAHGAVSLLGTVEAEEN